MVFALTLALLSHSESDLLDQVSGERMKATVAALAETVTRNTNSEGLTSACASFEAALREIPRLKVELMTYRATGRRMLEEKDVVQVVAVLPGRTDRRIMIGGHIDSLNLQVDPATGRAPGANDDASGVAVTMEMARLMSQREWENTLVFVAFSGEEQGLLGSTALAQRAKEEGWQLEAVLNNDTVGSPANLAGFRDDRHVRVFSEEGEEHNSRELARFCEWQVRRTLDDFGVKLVFRRDRFGRGGDHTPFVAQGFSGVRFIEVHEEYSRQHTPDDLPDYVDADYLRNVARANLAVLTALADAGPAPTGVRIGREQGHDTRLRWQATEGTSYTVYWRSTTSPAWEGSFQVGPVSEFTVPGINKDDHEFAVGAVGGVPSPAR